ncbi:MAG: hypothetical protein U9O85_07775 [Euryarchaeota archaeon]|nr:hypothetical protein [Euryarchaeota archaeon]
MSENIYTKSYPLEKVNITNFINYLADRGWNEIAFGREEVIKFQSPYPVEYNNYLEILIPAKRDLIDYTTLIEIAIDTISSFENRSFEDVLYQILIFGDLFKVRLTSPETILGSIPIEKGISLYSTVRDLLVYAASAEITPQKVYPRKLGEAMEFTENCLIDRSQYGSFIANIHCLLKRPGAQLDLEGKLQTQLGREVLLRIFRGLKNTEEAVNEESPDPIVENYLSGFNANMCDTLVDIVKMGRGSSLNFSAYLEPKIRIPEDVSTEITLSPSSEGYLVIASATLEGEIVPEKRELRGFVFELRKKPGKLAEKERFIRLMALTEEMGNLPIKIELDEKSYQLAIDAHKRMKKVRVTGILEKIGRSWYLKEPEDFKIIEGIWDYG